MKNTPITFAVFLCMAVILYTGMGLMFSGSGRGFSWLIYFLLGTILILGLFAGFIIWDVKRRTKGKDNSLPSREAQEPYPE